MPLLPVVYRVMSQKRHVSQTSLLDFVQRKKSPGAVIAASTGDASPSVPDTSSESGEQVPVKDEVEIENRLDNSHASTVRAEVGEAVPVSDNDIGHFAKYAGSLSDVRRAELLENVWIPPKGYKFPFSCHVKQGKLEKRYAKHDHLQNVKWLSYSHIGQGYYCK